MPISIKLTHFYTLKNECTNVDYIPINSETKTLANILILMIKLETAEREKYFTDIRPPVYLTDIVQTIILNTYVVLLHS